MSAVTTEAKRQAIVKAYGCHRVEDDTDDFYYARRHLAKLDHANAARAKSVGNKLPTESTGDGWHELRYQDEEVELTDAIEKALKIIRERDGVKYFKEVAGNLIDVIASNIEYHAGPLRRRIDRTIAPSAE